jgi:predicted ATPase/class 3 adenylate cyclase
MLSKYIPKHFAEIYRKAAENGFVRETGCVMFADLSGFTNLSEKLTAKGKEGSEEISRIINGVFEELISIVTSAGGSVYKFGGDAVTVFFPETIEKKEVLSAAVRMQKDVKKFSKIDTIAGECSISMKIGISYGSTVIGTLGSVNKQYFIAGETLDSACECEHHAEKGEIIVSENMTDGLPDELAQKLGDFFRIDTEKFIKSDGFKESKRKMKDQPDQSWFADYIDKELTVREKSGSIEKGELRNCTVIFLNFSGMDYGADFDYGLLNSFYTLVAVTTKKYQGFVNKIDMGDKGNKIIMLFGAPVSTEKNEEFSLRTIQEIKANRPEGIDIKAGVNNGNIYFGVVGASNRREFTVMGNTVNLSARLMASATANEIVISRKIKERVPEIETGEERKLKLKGVTELFPAYELKKILETRKSKRFRLIGRRLEQDQYQKVLKEKKAVLINIKAEAGLGKSVLINKIFEDRIKDAKCYMVNCLSYTKNNPYYAVKELIAKFAGAVFSDTENEKLKKLKKLLKAAGEEDNSDLFAEFMGWSKTSSRSSDPSLKDFFNEVCLSVFNMIARTEKAVLFVEDAHWMDEASADFFRSVINILDAENNCGSIHFVFRPDPLMEPFESGTASFTIELKNLEYDEGLEFITSKFNLTGIPAKIYEQIYQKTKGNPFFMEEILLGLKNDGDLIPVAGSGSAETRIVDKFMSERDRELAALEKSEIKYRLKPSVKSISIPDNVNDIVLARIDKLDENSKSILKIASVIGRIFQFDILKQLQNLKEIASQLDIRDSLFDLTKVDLTIFEETSENEYLFKHAITQEVAYETLLFSLRRKFHHKIAELYERNFRDNIANAYELLAFHYRHTDNKEKAKYYILKSAESAKNKFRYKEAFEFLKLYRKFKMTPDEKFESYFIDIEMLKFAEKRKEAIAIADKMMAKSVPGSLIFQRFLVKKLNLLRRSSEYKAVVEKFDGIKKFASDDLELEAVIEAALALIYSGDPERIKRAVGRMKKLLNKTSDDKLRVWALGAEALMYFRKRDFTRAIKLYLEVISISERLGLINEKFTALQNIAASYGQTGEMSKAEESFAKVYIEAKKTHNYNLLMRSIDGLSKVSYVKGEYKTAEKYIKDGIKLVEKTAKLNLKELLLTNLFNIRLEEKKYDEALKICDEREIILKKTGDNPGLAILNDNRGDVYFYKQNYAKAIDIYKENIKFADSVNNIEMVGHGYGNLANCYAETKNYDESIKYYKMQIDYAKEHNDIHSEGKAMYNLAYTYFHDLKDPKSSKECAVKAKELFEKTGFKRGLDPALELLKEIEENKAESTKL